MMSMFVGADAQSLMPCLDIQMNQFNERPLYLVLDPNDKRKDEVPLLAFQETVHIIEGKAHTKFTQTKFKLHADEAERISVVHAAEVTVQGSKGSSCKHLRTCSCCTGYEHFNLS